MKRENTNPMRKIILLFTQEQWSPYAAGILLGLTCILAVWLGNHLVGISSGIASIASTITQFFFADLAKSNVYFKYVIPPGMDWEIALLIGVFFGGLLAALSSKSFRLRWNEDPTWIQIFGPQPWKRFVVGFLGAMVLQYGASLAGGCTSGLAISGGMLLAPSAFLFMAGMFISGILVTWLVYRKRY